MKLQDTLSVGASEIKARLCYKVVMVRRIQPKERSIRRLRAGSGGDIVLLEDSRPLLPWTKCRERTRRAGKIMDERQFYEEKEETKQIPLVCPHCRQESTFPVRWMVRTKKSQPPRGGNEEDRAKFAKARSYMVRVDNMVACRNIKCRKRFDLTGQTVFLI